MMRVIVPLALSLAVAACVDPPEDHSGAEHAASPPGFAVFREPMLTITALEEPVAAPVTVGSTASPETIKSDAPDIVSIDPSGALVAHRDGRATLHGTGSHAPLLVEVEAPGRVAITPST